jgi:hypothetical protein
MACGDDRPGAGMSVARRVQQAAMAPQLEAVNMARSCNEIGALITRMQGAFLENPGLKLTLDEAARRFNVDRALCGAILATLHDAHVLSLGPDGTYRRRFPADRRTAGPNSTAGPVIAAA